MIENVGSINIKLMNHLTLLMLLILPLTQFNLVHLVFFVHRKVQNTVKYSTLQQNTGTYMVTYGQPTSWATSITAI